MYNIIYSATCYIVLSYSSYKLYKSLVVARRKNDDSPTKHGNEFFLLLRSKLNNTVQVEIAECRNE